jgi:hypothetical protein
VADPKQGYVVLLWCLVGLGALQRRRLLNFLYVTTNLSISVTHLEEWRRIVFFGAFRDMFSFHCFHLDDQRRPLPGSMGLLHSKMLYNRYASPIQYLASFSHAAQMTLRNKGFPLAASCGCTVILPKLDGARHSSLAP